METFCTSHPGICILFLLLQGLTVSWTADLNCATNPGLPAVLDKTNFMIYCDYTLTGSEQFRSVIWLVKTGNAFEKFMETIAVGQVVFTNTSIGDDYKSRITANMTATRSFIAINKILCKDETSYQITLRYIFGGTFIDVTKSLSISVAAAPKPISSFTYNPSQNLKEGTSVTFNCQANVGKPGGALHWTAYRNNTGSLGYNYTNQAVYTETDTPNSCTKDGQSQLTINLTRSDNELVMRCSVYHPTQPITGQDAYNQTGRIPVKFPIRETDMVVNSSPSFGSHIVGSTVRLLCLVNGNPAPTYIWTKEGNETITSNGREFTLRNLKMSDAGRYMCHASNDVDGVTYNATKFLSIIIVETTTSPTTTPGPSSSSTTGGNPGVTDGPKGAGVNLPLIIGLTIGIVAAIIIVIIVAIFILRRKKRKEIEEPPEKPWNNHHNINTMATQPDLVNDEKKFSNFNNAYDGKQDDGLAYADLTFDHRPRSRKPVALGPQMDYADISMPQV